jgi:hypothetical protein
MQKRLWQDQWSQHLDFIDPRVAQLRWLAIKRRFIQRLPNLVGFSSSLARDQLRILRATSL